MTRSRAGAGFVPSDLAAKYYTQRASAGLMVTEATQVSPQGIGYVHTPGIYTKEQVEGWRRVTDAVHQAGGRIFLQLWHVGRISNRSLQENNALPVAPSAIAPKGESMTIDYKMTPYETPRALETDEIAGIVEDFRKGAENAKAAGFDGVELHGANGYLIDQFLRDGTNKRTDQYGGAIENRLRLLKEVTQVLVDTVGADRTAVRLSPNDDPQGCGDSDSEALFVAAVTALNDFHLAFLEMRASRPDSSFRPATRDLVPQIRRAYKGPLVLNSDYHLKDAAEALASGRCDAIAFGRTFLANPDLPARLKANAPLNEPIVETYYTQGPEGYTDYPTLDRVPAE
jgi:N-ethylmaleimide reductase